MLNYVSKPFFRMGRVSRRYTYYASVTDRFVVTSSAFKHVLPPHLLVVFLRGKVHAQIQQTAQDPSRHPYVEGSPSNSPGFGDQIGHEHGPQSFPKVVERVHQSERLSSSPRQSYVGHGGLHDGPRHAGADPGDQRHGKRNRPRRGLRVEEYPERSAAHDGADPGEQRRLLGRNRVETISVSPPDEYPEKITDPENQHHGRGTLFQDNNNDFV